MIPALAAPGALAQDAKEFNFTAEDVQRALDAIEPEYLKCLGMAVVLDRSAREVEESEGRPSNRDYLRLAVDLCKKDREDAAMLAIDRIFKSQGVELHAPKLRQSAEILVRTGNSKLLEGRPFEALVHRVMASFTKDSSTVRETQKENRESRKATRSP